MRAWYDDDNKCNVYDAEAFLGVVEAFSDAVAMCKFAEAYTEYPTTVVNNVIEGAAAGGEG